MSKNKLAKFADMAQYANVVQATFDDVRDGGFALRGRWHEAFFHNDHPITIELGCGHGEYAVGLARRYADRNFVGVDIKGARMWHGATQALREGLTNVGFLRTRIELITEFFAPGEVAEIWITFADPQMQKPRKRLTSPLFMERYTRLLPPSGGRLHLKCDSNFLFTYTEAVAAANGLPTLCSTRDLHNPADAQAAAIAPDVLDALRSIRTAYEQQWLDRGIAIKYVCLAVEPRAQWVEPDIEIPLDDYRSFGRTGNSGLTTHV